MCWEQSIKFVCESLLNVPAEPGVRPISHTCSYAQDGCADYVALACLVSSWIKQASETIIFFCHCQLCQVLYQSNARLQLKDAFLHPANLPLDVPWSALAQRRCFSHCKLSHGFILCIFVYDGSWWVWGTIGTSVCSKFVSQTLHDCRSPHCILEVAAVAGVTTLGGSKVGNRAAPWGTVALHIP